MDVIFLADAVFKCLLYNFSQNCISGGVGFCCS